MNSFGENIYQLALMKYCAELGEEWLLQASKYVTAQYFIDPGSPLLESAECREFIQQKFEQDPLVNTIFQEAAIELMDAFHSIKVSSVSDFIKAFDAIRFVKERLSVSGEDRESQEERSHQLLTAGGKLKDALAYDNLLAVVKG